jgi:hypothetical protein
MQSVHHLTYERIGNELMSDLLAVCNPCHAWLSGKTDDDAVPAFLEEVQAGLRVYEAFDDHHRGCPGMCVYSELEEAAAYYGVCHDPFQRPSSNEWERLDRLATHFKQMLRL